jgi:excisionase family DNA binding protein
MSSNPVTLPVSETGGRGMTLDGIFRIFQTLFHGETVMKLYTVKEVAELLKVSEKTVREWQAARLIPFYKVSEKCVRISDRQIEAFLKKRERKMEVL